MMEKFIGGSQDGFDFPVENFERDVFYAGNIDTHLKEEYLRTKVEKNGLIYTFWVLKDFEAELLKNKIDLYLDAR